MPLSQATLWWLNLLGFALQTATGISWAAFNLPPHYAAAIAIVLGYLSGILNFAVHGQIQQAPAVPPTPGGKT